MIEKFNCTIDIWIDELERYTYQQLCLQPDPRSWSMGQVYTHLVQETKFYLQQINICLASNQNATEEMSAEAKSWFQQDSYPDEKLQGPAENPAPPQPTSKTRLQEDLERLKVIIHITGKEISASTSTGKTKHPGHHYFNAANWFQFAEMHFRHHFRQKQRLDTFLQNGALSD